MGRIVQISGWGMYSLRFGDMPIPAFCLDTYDKVLYGDVC